MKLVATGLPRFSNLVVEFLRTHAEPSHTFVAMNPFSRREKLRYLFELRNTDTVISLWGVISSSSPRAGPLKTALRLGKRVIQFWMGSDVLRAAQARDAFPPFVHDCLHVCEAEWTRAELQEIGISAEIVPRSPFARAVPATDSIHLPATFSVLAYVGDGSEEFYGLPHLIQLARDLPDVLVNVCGTSLRRDAFPPNLRMLGWSDDLDSLYEACTAFVRIPDHDGFSYSVREALAWGRPVVASYPYPHALHAPDYATLSRHVVGLEEAFHAGELKPNWEGREYVLREFAPETVFERLWQVLQGQ